SHPAAVPAMGQVLLNNSRAERVFCITDKPLNQNPHLSKTTAFGHHLFRRYGPPAAEVVSRLVASAFSRHPFGVERYMPDETPVRKIVLKNTAHKDPAVEALRNVLTKKDLPARLAGTVAKAVEELLLNAFSQSPTVQKGGLKKDLSMEEREWVELQIAASDRYLGLCVGNAMGAVDYQ